MELKEPFAEDNYDIIMEPFRETEDTCTLSAAEYYEPPTKAPRLQVNS